MCVRVNRCRAGISLSIPRAPLQIERDIFCESVRKISADVSRDVSRSRQSEINNRTQIDNFQQYVFSPEEISILGDLNILRNASSKMHIAAEMHVQPRNK